VKLELFLAHLFLTVLLAPSIALGDALTVGAGVGVILHEHVGGDVASLSGIMSTVFLEYRSDSTVGFRGEVSWMEFPENSPDIPPPAGSFYRYRSTYEDHDIKLSGGSVRLMWFKDHGNWVVTFASFVVGGYKVRQDEYSQIMVLLGPGFGFRLGKGRPSIGIELDMQMAIFEDASMFMVPVKAYAMFSLF